MSDMRRRGGSSTATTTATAFAHKAARLSGFRCCDRFAERNAIASTGHSGVLSGGQWGAATLALGRCPCRKLILLVDLFVEAHARPPKQIPP
jgi:hypothetical protein